MNRLKELIKDEHSAPLDYKKLLKETKNPADKMTILRIIKDEKRHERELRKMS